MRWTRWRTAQIAERAQRQQPSLIPEEELQGLDSASRSGVPFVTAGEHVRGNSQAEEGRLTDFRWGERKCLFVGLMGRPKIT